MILHSHTQVETKVHAYFYYTYSYVEDFKHVIPITCWFSTRVGNRRTQSKTLVVKEGALRMYLLMFPCVLLLRTKGSICSDLFGHLGKKEGKLKCISQHENHWVRECFTRFWFNLSVKCVLFHALSYVLFSNIESK